MFLKQSKSHNKIYLSFVQGYRDENGKIKHKTIEKLGYIEDLKKIYDDPIEHFKQVAKEKKTEEITEITIKNINTQKIDKDNIQKNLGYSILKIIYNELGINDFLNSKQREIKTIFKLNDIFSLLIFSRILYPDSKKGTYENKNIYFDKFDFSEKDMYRSLTYLKDYKEEIELLLWNNTKEKYNRDTSKTFYDCTNYYFEIEYNDDDIYELNDDGSIKTDKNGEKILKRKGYRKRGPEKNRRPDPIIEMGLLMDSSGIPIAYNLFSGNESEKNSLVPEIKRLKNKFNFNRTIVVADRGLNCSDNIIEISGTSLEMSKNKNGYVYGQTVRGADAEFKEWVLKKDEYITEIIEDEQENDKVKFIHKSRIYPKKMYIAREDKGKTKSGNKRKEYIIVDQKQMVYYSQKYADKQKHDRDMMIEKAKDLIKNPFKYNKATSYGAANYVKNLKFIKSTGEIADTTNLIFDEEKQKEEEKYDGYYSIVTSEENLTDIEIRNIYRGLARIENTFKVTKSTLESRPVYVWTTEHIEAHFLTCFVSLVIIRLLEEKLNRKFSPDKIIEALKNYTSTNIEHDIYIQNNYNDIIEEINNIYNLELDKKYRTLSQIKKLLNLSK